MRVLTWSPPPVGGTDGGSHFDQTEMTNHWYMSKHDAVVKLAFDEGALGMHSVRTWSLQGIVFGDVFGRIYSSLNSFCY